jgi:polysaccharide export outer membrane protein
MRQPTDIVRFLVAAAVALLMAACSSSSYPPAPASAATPDYRYIIGPLDVVHIVVWRNPELSMTVPVRDERVIQTPVAAAPRARRVSASNVERPGRNTSGTPLSP